MVKQITVGKRHKDGELVISETGKPKPLPEHVLIVGIQASVTAGARNSAGEATELTHSVLVEINGNAHAEGEKGKITGKELAQAVHKAAGDFLKHDRSVRENSPQSLRMFQTPDVAAYHISPQESYNPLKNTYTFKIERTSGRLKDRAPLDISMVEDWLAQEVKIGDKPLMDKNDYVDIKPVTPSRRR